MRIADDLDGLTSGPPILDEAALSADASRSTAGFKDRNHWTEQCFSIHAWTHPFHSIQLHDVHMLNRDVLVRRGVMW